MVAIITGKGVGIESSSVSVLGGNGQVGSAGLGRSGESVYLNAATGNLLLTTVDEMLVGRGPDAVISRTYNSLGAWDGDNNDNWRASAYRRVYNLTGTYGAAGSTVTRTDWDGSESVYSWNAGYTDGIVTGAYVSTDGAGAYDTLLRSGTTWTWTEGSSRVTETYDESNSGRITGKSDTSGNAISYTYNANGQLTQVTSGSEYTLLVYGSGGTATQLQYVETHTTSSTATTTRTYYEYDGSGRLSAVKVNLAPSDNSKTTGTNYTTSYTYDATSGKIATITQDDGTLVSFTYTLVGGVYRVTGISETIVTGTTRSTTISYDTANRVTTITDALSQVTKLTYDADGNLLSIVLPPSGTNDPAPSMSFTYEADGDVATMTSAGNTVTYGYDSHGNRTLERDSLGNTVVRSFSGNNLYSNANTAGFWSGTNANIAQTTDPLLGTALSLTATATNLSIASSNSAQVAVTAGQTLTFTVQLVAGSSTTASFSLLGGTSLFGNNADSSAIKISGPGTLTRISGSAFQVTGLDTGAITTVSVTRTFTQAENVVSRVYVGSASAGTTNGQSIVFANAGLSRPATNQLLTETRYTVPDPDGAGSGAPSGAMTTRYVYDSASRLRFTVDGEGLVTEYGYDSYGQQTSKMVYAGNSYSLSGLGDTTSITESALATWVSGISDKSNAQRTETSYDFRGNISQVTSYSKLLSTGAFDTTSERSQTTYIYSSHGELLSKQVDAGSIETYVYDGLSRITLTKEYVGPDNLYTNANTTGFWSGSNATVATASGTPAGTALSLTASTTNIASASPSASPIAVVHGDTLTYTIDLVGGSITTASLGLFGASSSFGNSADSTALILSGPGTLSQLSNGAFQVTGLATNQVTTIRITRTFTQSENISARVYVGSAIANATSGNSIIYANAAVMRGTLSKISYADSSTTGSTVAVTLANGLVQTSTYDRAGNLTTYAESGAGVTTATTNYKYDALGRLRIVADPTGQRQFFFYDNDGRKIADIDGDGSVTEYRYDAAGRLTSTTAYATRLTSNELTSGNATSLFDASGNPTSVTFSTIRPATDSSNDRWGWTFYDLAGRAIRTIDGTGAVTVLEYDGTSQLVSTTEMATRMSAGAIMALKDAAIGVNLYVGANSASYWTAVNATIADSSGKVSVTATANNLSIASSSTHQIAVVAGDTLSFTVELFASANQSVASVGMLGGTSLFGNLADTSIEILSQAGGVTLSNLGGSAWQVSGLSTTVATKVLVRRTFTQAENVTARVYVGSGSTGTTIGKQILFTNATMTRAPSLPALPATDATNDRVVRNFYDNAGRLIGTLDAEGYISKVEYDKAGRRIHTVARKTKPTTTTGSFATIFASATADNAKDIHDWWVYDARGLLRATIDAEGTVTRMDYTAAGDLSQQTRGQLIASLTSYMTTPPKLADLPAAGVGEILSVTAWTYNGFGQPLTQVTTLSGSTTTTTSYSYDIMRNLVSTTTQVGGDARTYAKRYDQRGRLTSELSGDGNAALAALGSNPTQTQIDNLYLQYGWSYTYDTADRLIAKTAPSGTNGVAGAKTLYYYNPDNSLAYEVDALGQVTGYVYNAFGERADVIAYADTVNLSGMTGGTSLTQVTGSSNLVANATLDSLTHTDFNVDGTVKQVTDPLSNVSTFTYNAFGELASSSIALDNDGAGGAARAALAEKAYDRRGLLKQEKLNSVVVATYDYDAFGRAITLTNALSKSTTSNYDRKGRLTSTVDALGNTTTYTYDARDNLVAVKDALNNLTRYVYDKANRRVATIDALGGLTTVRYDGDGRVIAERAFKNIVTISASVLEIAETNATYTAALANVDAAADHVTRYAYDKDGQLRFAADGLGHVVGYVNDANGNVVRTTAYDGTVDPALADSSYTEAWLQGQVDAFTSTNHRVTRSIYDATNRLSYAIDAIGQVSWFVYDAKGLLTKTVEFAALYAPTADPSLATMDSWRGTNANATNDRTSRAWYDRKGQLAYSIDALGYVTFTEYDKAGNVKRTTAFASPPVLTPGDTTTLAQLAADANLSTALTTRRVTQFKYDAAGRLEETIDPEGYSTKLVLDAAGQITSSTQGFGTSDASTTAYVYDDLGRVVKVTRANGATEATATWFFYDAIGQQTAAIDGDNYLAVSTYDAVGNRLTDTRYANAITGAFTSASTVAQLLTLAGTNANDVATSAAYDIFRRVKNTTDGRSSVVSSTYDKTDRLLTVTQEMESGTTDDRITTYSYDNFGGVVKTVDARGNASFAYYDKLGRVTRQVDGEKFVTDTSYTRGGQVASVKRWANALAVTVTETTVPASPTADSTRDATTTFAYDKRDLLTSTTDAVGYTESYILNAFGERTTVTNKLGGSTLYTYDKRGLVLTETLPITTKNSGGTTISVVNSYRYDARGNRTKMVEAGLMDAAGAIVSASSAVEARTTNYSYDKLDRVVQTTGDAVTVVNDDLTNTTGVVPTTTIKYDRRGNTVETIDPTGARSLSWYDHMGRVIAQVVQTEKPSGVEKGVLTRTTYDKNGNVADTKVYGDLITLPASVTATLPTAVDVNNYRLTTFTYDRSNRLLTTSVAGLITGEWTGSAYALNTSTTITTSFEYDKAGNAVRQYDGRNNPVYSWYDKLGRQVAQIDAENYLTVWTRDAEGNALAETRYANKVTGSFTTTTDPATLSGLLGTGATDANRTTTFTYDKSGQRLTETRASVAYTSINTSSGAATDSTAGAVVTYTYNGLGQVLSKAEANGDTTTYTYDTTGRLTLETGQSFKSNAWTSGGDDVTPRTAYTYDGLNNLKSMRVQAGASANDANDRVITYTYGAGGRLLGMTDAVDNERIRLGQLSAGSLTRTYGYDIAGRTVRDQYARIKSDSSSVTEARITRYDLAGRAITETTARYNGSSWVFTSELSGNPAYDAIRTRYNAYGEVSGRGLTAGPAATAAYQETFDYDAGGRLWRSNTGDGVLRFHVYDKAGNETLTLASVGADLSALTVSNYTASITSTGDTGTTDAVTSVSVFDKRGQLVQTREVDRQFATGTTTPVLTTGIITRGKAYNAFGEVVSETDPRGYNSATGAELAGVADFRTTFEYNTMGRLTKKTSARVDATSASGVTTSITPVETYGYDLSGRLVSIRDATSHYLGMDYRTTRLLLAGTGHGDSEALITKEFHPDTGIAETQYDVFGDARELINEVGSVQLRDYDKLGRLTVQTHAQRPVGAVGNVSPSAAVQLVDYFAYDVLGQRIQHWNSQLTASVKETTDYDAQGRVTKTVGFGGDTTTYSYSWNAAQETAGMATGGAAFGGWTKVTHAWAAPSGKDLTETQDYFGRTVYQKDYGDHVYSFTFNLAGQLTARSNGAGESIGFTYFNTGLVSGQTGTQGTAAYSYDVAGNRVTESYVKSGTTWRSAVAQYDALNRMTRWDESGISGYPAWISWKYDAVGNVRNYQASHKSIDTDGAPTNPYATPNEDAWYLYDEMNRVTLNNGYLDSGTIVRSSAGQAITYYLDGNRRSVIYQTSLTGQRWAYVSTGGGGGPPYEETIPDEGGENGEWIVTTGTFTGDRREEFTYSADGFLVQTRKADATRTAGTNPGDYIYGAPPSTANQSVADYVIDAMGRTTYYKEWGGSDGYYERSSIVYDNGNRVLSETAVTVRSDSTSGPLSTYTTYYTNSYTNGLLTSQYQDAWKQPYGGSNSDGAADDSRQNYTYVWWDGALQSGITNDKDDDGDTDWTTAFTYDSSGRILKADIDDGRDRDVNFVTDQNGMIVNRQEARIVSGSPTTNASPRDIRYFFAGAQLGHLSNNGTDNMEYAASIKDRLTPAYTLTGIFRKGGTTATVYADFAQSYDAINGISNGSTSTAYTVNGGETLEAIAQAIWGDASLWYLIADANGLTASSTLAAGQVLTIPNKVHNLHNSADTWRPYDPNEAIGDVSPTMAKPPKKPKCGMFGQFLALVVAAVVMWALPQLGGIVGSLLAPFVANAASQGVLIATGNQEKFSWKSMAITAVGQVVGAFNPLGGIPVIGDITTSIATQGISKAIGLQKKFNWADVAVAGAMSAMDFIPGFSKLPSPLRTVGKGVVGAATRSLVTGTNFGDNLVAVLPQVIVQTMGDIVQEALTARDDPRKSIKAKKDIGDKNSNSYESSSDAVIINSKISGACFVAGTLVHTERGLAAIETLQEGDLVLSRSENGPADEIRLRPVVRRYVHEISQTYELVVASRETDAECRIVTTAEHPFWVVERGWTDAGNLASGDVLLLVDGTNASVQSIIKTGEQATVYNITVAEDHTYFVHQSGVWVHNKYSDPDAPRIPNPHPVTLKGANGGADYEVYRDERRVPLPDDLRSLKEGDALYRMYSALARAKGYKYPRRVSGEAYDELVSIANYAVDGYRFDDIDTNAGTTWDDIAPRIVQGYNEGGNTPVKLSPGFYPRNLVDDKGITVTANRGVNQNVAAARALEIGRQARAADPEGFARLDKEESDRTARVQAAVHNFDVQVGSFLAGAVFAPAAAAGATAALASGAIYTAVLATDAAIGSVRGALTTNFRSPLAELGNYATGTGKNGLGAGDVAVITANVTQLARGAWQLGKSIYTARTAITAANTAEVNAAAVRALSPANARYTLRPPTVTAGNAAEDVGVLTPAGRAAAKGYPGIGVTANGGPTFAGTSYLYPVGAGQRSVVEIVLTGSRRADFKAANRLGGFAETPEGYTWHHVDDFNPVTGTSTLELVETGAHRATYPHSGSVSQYEKFFGVTYKR